MTKEEYKEHLCDVIKMVFLAELETQKKMPELNDRLKEKAISADEYVGYIADEILSHDPMPIWAREE